MCRWIAKGLTALLVLVLVGCGGTIQRESSGGARRIEGGTYRNVEVVLSPAARHMQAENPQFSVRELSDYVRRRLESQELLRADSRFRVEVTIESFRVRSAVAAVLFGIMAGTDSIDGYVRVYDNGGRQVHGYKVNASYGLGGWAGGQDGTRMNWMYDKFAELAVAELGGKTQAVDLAKGRAVTPAATAGTTSVSITPVGNTSARTEPAAAAPIATSAPASSLPIAPPVAASVEASPPAPIASGFAVITDVDVVPYLSDKGRNGYREWLTRPTPRAFALSNAGHWSSAHGLKPADATMPLDPTERAVALCNRHSPTPCRLYAVNGAVVWTREPAVASAAVPARGVQSIGSASPEPAAMTQVNGKHHARAVPVASGFADGSNADAVPVRGEGKDRYAHYLTLSAPKAFVVYENGGWRFWSNSPDSMTTLLDKCAREGRKCWLYAVDNHVVWRGDEAQRIGRSDQLGAR